jgi:hypothetical protein
MAALPAVRSGQRDAFAARHTHDADVQEAAEREAHDETD